MEMEEKEAQRKHTNAIKPLLTDTNKNNRLFFCISSCIYDEQTYGFKFSDMSNIVHIDEKLFYLTRTQQMYYLTPREPEPHGEIQSKRFVPKIMFMCAVAKSMYSSEGELIFDGKIGTFPFTAQVLAQRRSKNRNRGEQENSIYNKDTHKPEGASKIIYNQQDNAKPHILDNDPIFREAANQDGFNIHLVQQAPNSPDMNKAAYNYTQLVRAVTGAFEALEHHTLSFVWITLQVCKVEVLNKLGGINYHIPHMNKSKLAREGRLPDYLTVRKEIIYESLSHLDVNHLEVAYCTWEIKIKRFSIKQHNQQ
ncbi:uncharacterized protein LOC130824869 [Amaranthus tricolor]|uniref:uncharacterized protein LOC130824869 n=1 Tax=Amaranthus tricolor TaxID=29722 RepID=UPI00258FCF07|nr:uncharacterized protein LOC130824869 [Amaranthus tricolor]